METKNKNKFSFEEKSVANKRVKYSHFPTLFNEDKNIHKKKKNIKLKVKLASFSKNKLKKQRQRKERIEKMLKKYEKTLEVHQQSKLNTDLGFKTIIMLFFELLKIIIIIWKFITGN